MKDTISAKPQASGASPAPSSPRNSRDTTIPVIRRPSSASQTAEASQTSASDEFEPSSSSDIETEYHSLWRNLRSQPPEQNPDHRPYEDNQDLLFHGSKSQPEDVFQNGLNTDTPHRLKIYENGIGTFVEYKNMLPTHDNFQTAYFQDGPNVYWVLPEKAISASSHFHTTKATKTIPPERILGVGHLPSLGFHHTGTLRKNPKAEKWLKEHPEEAKTFFEKNPLMKKHFQDVYDFVNGTPSSPPTEDTENDVDLKVIEMHSLWRMATLQRPIENPSGFEPIRNRRTVFRSENRPPREIFEQGFQDRGAYQARVFSVLPGITGTNGSAISFTPDSRASQRYGRYTYCAIPQKIIMVNYVPATPLGSLRGAGETEYITNTVPKERIFYAIDNRTRKKYFNEHAAKWLEENPDKIKYYISELRYLVSPKNEEKLSKIFHEQEQT